MADVADLEDIDAIALEETAEVPSHEIENTSALSDLDDDALPDVHHSVVDNELKEALNSALQVSEVPTPPDSKDEVKEPGNIAVPVHDSTENGNPVDFTFKTSVREKQTEEQGEKYDLADVIIPQEQLEKVLERVVKDMVSEKVEDLLSTVIERNVSEEIKRIKDVLLKYSKED